MKTTQRQAVTSPRSPSRRSLSTPVDVCLLPLMDPAVQFSLMSGLRLAASMPRGSSPALTVDLYGQNDGRELSASYHLDLRRGARPFCGTGLLGTTALEASATMSDTGMGELCERVGRSQALVWFRHQDGGMRLEGTVARLPVRLDFQQRIENARVHGFRAEGQLGSDVYSIEAWLSGIERPVHDGAHIEVDFLVRGSIGFHPIVKLYHLTSLSLPHGEELHWSGEGRIGDVYQRLNLTLSLTG